MRSSLEVVRCSCGNGIRLGEAALYSCPFLGGSQTHPPRYREVIKGEELCNTIPADLLVHTLNIIGGVADSLPRGFHACPRRQTRREKNQHGSSGQFDEALIIWYRCYRYIAFRGYPTPATGVCLEGGRPCGKYEKSSTASLPSRTFPRIDSSAPRKSAFDVAILGSLWCPAAVFRHRQTESYSCRRGS